MAFDAVVDVISRVNYMLKPLDHIAIGTLCLMKSLALILVGPAKPDIYWTSTLGFLFKFNSMSHCMCSIVLYCRGLKVFGRSKIDVGDQRLRGILLASIARIIPLDQMPMC